MRRLPVVWMVVALVAAACGAEPSDVPAETTTTTTATVAATTTTTVVPDEPADVSFGPAPWDVIRLSRAAVPNVLVEQWEAADNRAWCSALFPENQNALGAGAAIRSANFGGGWGVAWDMSDGPGRNPDGSYCDDCGRGAFGVAGIGVPAVGDEDEKWTDRIAWADGSKAGYGFEGSEDAGSGAPLLMSLLVQNEGCSYDVWSFLGEDHLLSLVSLLRRVEGLAGSPTPWQNQIVQGEVDPLGEPSWVSEAALSSDDIDPLYLDEWVGEAGAPGSCPLLVFADLGEEASGAVMRRAANVGEMLVAWDRPGGPGHDGASEPCEDCGRGAVGLGTFQFDVALRGPVTHAWADGSSAAAFAGFYGTEMHLRPAGFDCTYWLWSHLGPDHLDYLLTQLRRVEGHPPAGQ